MKEKKIFISFKPTKELFIILLIFATGVFINFLSDLSGRGSILFYFLYQGIFAIGICISFPVLYTVFYKKTELSDIGISSVKPIKAILTGIIIAIITVSGNLIGKKIVMPSLGKIVSLIVCLMMSTLFEEVFFRGFLQTKFEKYFGIIPSVIIAGVCFSLYHIGYSDMVNAKELIVLAIIGITFSISFRITKNIITSYIVNLPNAIVSFLDDKSYFTLTSAIISAITIIIGIIIIIYFNNVKKTFSGSVK